MTLAPRRAPLPFSDVDDVAEAIRARGGRLTSARRVLLEGLFTADRPIGAEYLAAGMEGRITPSDLSSVYRNLELLEELGVVRHVHLGHGAGLYEIERGDTVEYLVCEHCHRVDVIEAKRLDRARNEIRKQSGYEARFSHFPISGLCADCAADGAHHHHHH